MFSIISYLSRNALLYKTGPVQFFTVDQEMEAEMRLVNMSKKIFSQETEVVADTET